MKNFTSKIIYPALCISIVLLIGCGINYSWQEYGSFSIANLYRTFFNVPQLWMLGIASISFVLLHYVIRHYNKTLQKKNPQKGQVITLLFSSWGVFLYVIGTTSVIKHDFGYISGELYWQYNQSHPLVFGLIGFIPFSILMGIIIQKMLDTELKNKQFSEELNKRNELLLNDVKERKLNEMKLKEAKKEALAGVKAKDQFLSNMSHEIRTPLNGIIGLVNIMSTTNLDEQQAKYLKNIQFSSEILMTLINQVLDISKINSEKLTLEHIDFDVNEVVDGAVNTFKGVAEEKGITLRSIFREQVPLRVCGDPIRLNQILLNILGNALKFTNEGGVDLIVNSKHTDDGPRLQFEINDTGIGIPDDKLDKIFESFEQASIETTREFGGSGLGLAISKELVELYGGNIKVESKVGKGTSFSFEIQLKPAKKLKSQKKPDQPIPYNFETGEIKVLIAEDNEVNRMVATITLEKLGFKTDVAVNGQEVIDKIFENEYDIILMDVRMPIMSGLDATRFIRNATEPPICNIPIIALSASTLPAEIQSCYDVGMNDHLPKPFKPQDLMKCFSKYFNNEKTDQSKN